LADFRNHKAKDCIEKKDLNSFGTLFSSLPSIKSIFLFQLLSKDRQNPYTLGNPLILLPIKGKNVMGKNKGL
jgi:hypothetical protein